MEWILGLIILAIVILFIKWISILFSKNKEGLIYIGNSISRTGTNTLSDALCRIANSLETHHSFEEKMKVIEAYQDALEKGNTKLAKQIAHYFKTGRWESSNIEDYIPEIKKSGDFSAFIYLTFLI